jgi:UDP-glucose 4-epimerase
MKRTIVVTGASGFIGRSVVVALTARGAEVVPVARTPLAGALRVYDYADSPAADVLVHLAEDNDRMRVNSAGDAYESATLRTLNALIAKRYATIVYASSALLYGDGNPVPRKATDAVASADAYTRIKKRCEDAVRAARAGIVARLANIYGPGMAQNNVLSTIIRQIPGAGPVYVRDDTPVRDFVHVSDASAAIAAMALEPGTSGVYNVGTGRGISVRELARLALSVAGEGSREVVATHPLSRRSCLVLDIGATTAAWGWAPRTDLAAALAELMQRGKR